VTFPKIYQRNFSCVNNVSMMIEVSIATVYSGVCFDYLMSFISLFFSFFHFVCQKKISWSGVYLYLTWDDTWRFPMKCSLVFSRLYYCSSVWDNTSKKNIAKLQNVQNFAAGIITDTKKYDLRTSTQECVLTILSLFQSFFRFFPLRFVRRR